MEIAEIRRRLSIGEVLGSYGLGAKGGMRPYMLRCPFHEDGSPSFQIYPQTGTFCCHSANCRAGTGDVIELVRLLEGCTKYEAIMKCKGMAGASPPAPKPKDMETPTTDITREAILLRFMESCAAGLSRSPKARAYMEARGIAEAEKAGAVVGYCSARSMEAWAEPLREAATMAGLLRGGKPHLAGCLTFALLDAAGNPQGYYGRALEGIEPRHRYLPGGIRGLFPRYPKEGTARLILAESPIDALCCALEGMEAVALYGTNGFRQEHKELVEGMGSLAEVVLMLDGDEAGKAAASKIAKEIKAIRPDIAVKAAEMPEGEDCASMAAGHERGILAHLAANAPEWREIPAGDTVEARRVAPPPIAPTADHPTEPRLEEKNPHSLLMRLGNAEYEVLGKVPSEWEHLRVSLRISTEIGAYRAKTDLYETRQSERLAKELSERIGLDAGEASEALALLADLLDERRREQENEGKGKEAPRATKAEIAAYMDFLRKPELAKRLNALIGQSGVVGEERARMLLFMVASSRGTAEPLHALVQGGSGSGKTHLMGAVCALMPPEHTHRLTRITEGSLFNYGEHELTGRLLAIEDMDGLGEQAVYALRELQSSGALRSSTSGKDALGNPRGGERIVYGPVATLACTTKGHIYEDNAGRCLTVAVDEGAEQTARVTAYQSMGAAGLVDKEAEGRAKKFMQGLCRLVKPLEVVNPHAPMLSLPEGSQKVRRLHPMLLGLVEQSARWHQYQREKDGAGRIIATAADIRLAATLMMESIVLKVDELDGSLRAFFERLKEHVQDEAGSFTQREIRLALGISKTRLHGHIQSLLELEYIAVAGGHANRGYQYRISYWDDNKALRKRIRDHIYAQLDAIEHKGG